MQTAVAIGCAIALPISIFLMCKAAAEVKLYGEGQEIMNGTTGLTANELRMTDRIGNVAAPAGQTFYIVSVQATNHSLAGSTKFHPNTARLYTPDGASLRASEEGQKALDELEKSSQLAAATLVSGGKVSRDLVFVGQAHLVSTRLGFSANGPVGDILEDLVGGNVNILMPADEPQFQTR